MRQATYSQIVKKVRGVCMCVCVTLATIHPTQGRSSMQVFSIHLHFCFASAHRDGRGCSVAPYPTQSTAQRVLCTKEVLNQSRCQPFPSYHFSPKERMYSYWSPTKYANNCEKKMWTVLKRKWKLPNATLRPLLKCHWAEYLPTPCTLPAVASWVTQCLDSLFQG